MDAAARERYSRQILFAGIGERGQEALLGAHAAIAGCGALGSFHAAALARAGVGRLTIIDRDYVEPANLHRQWLFEESDAAEALPKAAAAARRLRAINSSVTVRGVVADLTPANAAGSAGRRGRDSGRHGQFRNAFPDQRFCGEPRHSVDLRRGGGQLRAHHAGDSRAHRLPALRVSGAARGRAAHLRDGRRAERGGVRGGLSAGGGCAEDSVRARRSGLRRASPPSTFGRAASARSRRRRATPPAPPAGAANFRTWRNRRGRRPRCAGATRCRCTSASARSTWRCCARAWRRWAKSAPTNSRCASPFRPTR